MVKELASKKEIIRKTQEGDENMRFDPSLKVIDPSLYHTEDVSYVNLVSFELPQKLFNINIYSANLLIYQDSPLSLQVRILKTGNSKDSAANTGACPRPTPKSFKISTSSSIIDAILLDDRDLESSLLERTLILITSKNRLYVYRVYPEEASYKVVKKKVLKEDPVCSSFFALSPIKGGVFVIGPKLFYRVMVSAKTIGLQCFCLEELKLNTYSVHNFSVSKTKEKIALHLIKDVQNEEDLGKPGMVLFFKVSESKGERSSSSNFLLFEVPSLAPKRSRRNNCVLPNGCQLTDCFSSKIETLGLFREGHVLGVSYICEKGHGVYTEFFNVEGWESKRRGVASNDPEGILATRSAKKVFHSSALYFQKKEGESWLVSHLHERVSFWGEKQVIVLRDILKPCVWVRSPFKKDEGETSPESVESLTPLALNSMRMVELKDDEGRDIEFAEYLGKGVFLFRNSQGIVWARVVEDQRSQTKKRNALKKLIKEKIELEGHLEALDISEGTQSSGDRQEEGKNTETTLETNESQSGKNKIKTSGERETVNPTEDRKDLDNISSALEKLNKKSELLEEKIDLITATIKGIRTDLEKFKEEIKEEVHKDIGEKITSAFSKNK